MTKLSASLSSSFSRVVKRSLVIFFFFFLLMAGWLVIWSLISVSSLKQLQFDQSARQAQMALAVTKPINFISNNQLSLMTTWQAGLKLVTLLPEWNKYLTSSNINSTSSEETQLLPPQFMTQTFAGLDQISQHQSKIKLFSQLTPKPMANFLNFWQAHSPELKTLISDYLLNDHTILLVFQNSHELRATGGFMGSYALLKTKSGQIESLVVEDIYDADGQFTGFVSAPPGVQEYLSSARGMRLPDSNWQAEFSQSAQNILQYFALGNRSNIDTVMAVNHSVLENLLQLTGPVYLPDYHQTITAETAVNLLENRPGAFFAGSGQKKHLISQLLNQMMLKTEDLTTDDWSKLLALLPRFVSQKDLQIYSIQPKLQAKLEQLNLTGSWTWPENTDLIGWVESNVGINKVNKYVTRSLEIELKQYQTQIFAQFDNTDSLQYTNYQRVYIPSQWQVVSVVDHQKEIVDWHLEIIELASGQTVGEIGFLMLVPGYGQQAISLVFDRRNNPLTEGKKVYLPKQSGLPPVPITITRTESTVTLVWEKDEIL
ncbi:DUF4012 domain-containing protein [Patescibacteria group bacterium]|nr:DUF4012 domain-containing protein [Patescibacteria group bacterium]